MTGEGFESAIFAIPGVKDADVDDAVVYGYAGAATFRAATVRERTFFTVRSLTIAALNARL